MALVLWLIAVSPICALAALLAHSYWRVWVRRLRRGRRTVGTIVETSVEIAEDDDGGYERRYATVAFETPQGLHRQRVQLLSKRTVAGQQVPVRYDAADPANISLREPKTIAERVLSFFFALLFEVWTIWIIVSAILFVILLSVWLPFWR